MFTGSLVALVTPMLADGALDMPRFRALIDWHIDQGTDGLVIVGTTGESPTVNTDEHCLLIRSAVEQAAGRIPVIAGTGANSTAEAIELTRCAKAAGAAAGLSVAPYYNKPTQEGLYQHFKAIAEAVDLPLILYNVPGRTVADISNDTALRLAKLPGVIGIKDATGNIERGSALLKAAPASFSVYSGDDASGMVLMLLGAQGRHFRHQQRRAQADARNVRRRDGRRPAACARHQLPLARVAPETVRGSQSDSRQMGACRDGAYRIRHPSALGSPV